MSDFPQPLTPADCDLRSFQFMPLDVVRLRDSDIAVMVSGEEFRSAVMLWCASWHQVPAGSIPTDDRSLALLAGYGRAVAEWLKVKAGALRGWIECSDGRLYHPVVCEKARSSWDEKLSYEYDKLVDRLRKLNKKREESGLPSIAWPSFDDWKSMGRPLESKLVPMEKKQDSGGKQIDSGGSDGGSGGIPPEKALKGEVRESKGKGEDKTVGTPKPRAIPNPPRQPGDWLAHFRDKHGVILDPSSVHDRKKAWPIFTAWCNAGLTLERVDAAVITAQAQATETIAFLPAYVDRVIASQSAPKPVSASEARAQEREEVFATLGGRKPSHERTSDTFDVDARRID